MMFYRHFHHLLRISGAKYLNHEVVVHLERAIHLALLYYIKNQQQGATTLPAAASKQRGLEVSAPRLS